MYKNKSRTNRSYSRRHSKKEQMIKDIITKRESEVGKFKDYESLLIDSGKEH